MSVPGTPVSGWVTRNSGSLAVNAGSGPTRTVTSRSPVTTIATLICRQFMGTLLEPLQDSHNLSSYGVKGDVYQPHLVVADWPAGTTTRFPVIVGDTLYISTTEHYEIRGVRTYEGDHLELIVEVTAT